eukprot:COSAG02_NODE_23429_length_719_cov_0.824194_1_plen_110_part_00
MHGVRCIVRRWHRNEPLKGEDALHVHRASLIPSLGSPQAIRYISCRRQPVRSPIRCACNQFISDNAISSAVASMPFPFGPVNFDDFQRCAEVVAAAGAAGAGLHMFSPT